MREARQVVERVHQALHEVGLGSLPQLGALLDRALLEIVVFGGETEVLVLQVRELSLEAGYRLLRELDQRAGLGRVRRLRPPRLLWIVAHKRSVN